MGIGEHVTAGAVAGYVVAIGGQYVGLEVNTALLVVGGVFGAMLCDIDIEESFLGRKVPTLSCLINSWVGHRTLTHSLLFMLIIGAVVGLFNVNLGLGIALGILSHIALDLVGYGGGVAYLYPFKKQRIKIK